MTAVTFINTEISAFDKATQPNGTDGTPPETANTSISHLHLGSFKKAVSLAEFADVSAGNKLAYNEFRPMLEAFLNKFRLSHEGYLRVKSDQEVSEPLYSSAPNVLLSVF